MIKIKVEDLIQTRQLAVKVANFLKDKQEYYLLLKGQLGAGKTTFSKFLIRELGVEENVSSPTFVIMNQYETNQRLINHVDAYRLSSNEDMGMYLEQFDHAINIIEWYENMNLKLDDSLCLRIEIINANETREFIFNKEI